MPNWFQWKDERSTLAKYGLYVVTHPSICVPAERIRDILVPGRSGSLTQFEGEGVYDDFIASAECMVRSPATIPAIAGWLKGSGDVVFGNQPDYFFKGRVANQIEFEKVMRGRQHRSCVVNFRCAPYRYHANGNTQQTISTRPTAFINPGTAPSEPLIRVNGSGDFGIWVGTEFISFTAVNGYIVLDTARKEAYRGTTLQNNKMIGEFPLLWPGTNLISWDGPVTSLVITPRWRSL